MLRSRLHQRVGDDRGQAIILVAAASVMLIGLAAFAVDVGYILNAHRQLQASTDAAATAAAQELNTQSRANVTAKAVQYSAIAGNKNTYSNLPGVSITTTYKCLTTVNLPTPCTNPATANAVTVVSTATMPLFLARVLGINTMQISASATALMKGGGPPPLDVMIIIDTTASMNSDCSATIAGVSDPSKLDCAKAGVRALLDSLWPCHKADGACGTVTNGHVAKPYDEVGLMFFPGLKASAAISQQYDCARNVSSSGSYSSWDIAKYNASPNYFLKGLSSDYKTSAVSALNGSVSNLVKAVDWTHGNTCGSNSYGLESPGGVGTYFAGAITQARTALAASSRSAAVARKVLILVSDGDAGADSGDISSAQLNDQCAQAITAADAAAAANMWVYSVAYEASTSSTGSCARDTPRISAYSTMQQIASDSTKFYSQASPGDLSVIFQKIAADLTTTRIVDDSTP